MRVVEGSRSRIQVFQGVVHPPPGWWRPGDLHGPQDQLRRRRGADLPGAQPVAGQDRGRHPRPGAPGQALLPALAARQGGPHQGAPRAALTGFFSGVRHRCGGLSREACAAVGQPRSARTPPAPTLGSDAMNDDRGMRSGGERRAGRGRPRQCRRQWMRTGHPGTKRSRPAWPADGRDGRPGCGAGRRRGRSRARRPGHGARRQGRRARRAAAADPAAAGPVLLASSCRC